MTSPQRIKSVLVNYCNADSCKITVSNNRYIYTLKFTDNIGWEWLSMQVGKASADVDRTIELWKIEPAASEYSSISVREVERRPDIDDSQESLLSFK